jgi:hypothetical protein
MATKFIQFWGDELVPVPSEHLDRFNLSFDTRNFLITLGLPSKAGKLSSLIKEYLDIDFQDAPKNKINKFSFQQETYVSIANSGRGYGIITCIKEVSDEIFSLDTNEDSSTPICLVNSTIQQFFLFLQIFLENYLLIIYDIPTNESMIIGSKMRQVFNRLDAKALEDEASFWPSILYEIEIGMI